MILHRTVGINMKFLVFISIFNLVIHVQCREVRIDPLVLINQGLVRGEKSDSGKYSTFLGIPYAQVDVANPFGEAFLAPSFGDDVFNANQHITCYQPYTEGGSLDCLRLNIHVPTQASSKNPLPVYVYIHGGGFSYGFGEVLDDHSLLNQDIVVVTINYRLSVYGFLCLDIPTVPGNQGLKDQYAALRWVRENIAAFGGNPYNVTIGGESAGGASVVHQMFSPHEKLFHKAIIQSGVAQTNGLYTDGDKYAAIKLAQYLGLNTTDTNQALAFLIDTSPQLVIAANEELKLSLLPCKEQSFSGVDNFVTEDPFTISNPSKIANTPVLIGVTSNEMFGLLNIFFNHELNDNFFKEFLQDYFNFDNEELGNAANLVKHFYIGDMSIDGDVISQMEPFLSDFSFNHPTDSTITKLLNENAGPIYSYVFNYASENDGGDSDNAQHASEMKYLFGDSYNDFTENDKVISNRMTTLWGNFIKYGNPTPQTTELIDVSWEQIDADSRPYMKIGIEMSLQSRFRKESMAFWDLFYTSYGSKNKFVESCSIDEQF